VKEQRSNRILIKSDSLSAFTQSLANRKLKWQYPGVMAIVIYSLFFAAILELSLAYVLYEPPSSFYNFP